MAFARSRLRGRGLRTAGDCPVEFVKRRLNIAPSGRAQGSIRSRSVAATDRGPRRAGAVAAGGCRDHTRLFLLEMPLARLVLRLAA